MTAQLAVERVFLQTSVQLIGEGSSGLLEKQAEALERLSWDWIINAEKYVEPKYAELHRAREKVRHQPAEVTPQQRLAARLLPCGNHCTVNATFIIYLGAGDWAVRRHSGPPGADATTADRHPFCQGKAAAVPSHVRAASSRL